MRVFLLNQFKYAKIVFFEYQNVSKILIWDIVVYDVSWNYLICIDKFIWYYIIFIDKLIHYYIICIDKFLWYYIICIDKLIWYYIICIDRYGNSFQLVE